MTFKEISTSGLLWTLVLTGIILVALMTLYYFRLCYKNAVEMGVEKETLKKVIKSSVSFSIVPSIAIVTGLVTLSVVIGLPYSWFRLSVIGSVAYEVMAANMALSALGLDVNNADGYAFGLMAWAMCLAITVSLIFNVFFNKKIHLGTLKLGEGDKKWSPVAQSVFMSALLVSLIVPMLFGDVPSLLTFVTSALLAVLISVIVKKTGASWLGQFTLTFSMIGAMIASVFFDKLV